MPMPSLSRRLKQLDNELLALGEETMLIEKLDGFVAMSTGSLGSSWSITTLSLVR